MVIYLPSKHILNRYHRVFKIA